ncbi:MAG: hypothetical protein ACREUT_01095 [Steroidobacteraceae bacterium]
MNLNLTEAFGRFGAKPHVGAGSTSAIAADGAVVLACSRGSFRHPAAGVLRYEDRLAKDDDRPKDVELLARHLTLALDAALPIRMVVVTSTDKNKPRGRSFDVRPDLIGKVVKFDGEHFIIDFRRMEAAHAAGAS